MGSFNNREYKEYDHDFEYNPDGDYRKFSDGQITSLSMTHVLGQRTFYEIKGAIFEAIINTMLSKIQLNRDTRLKVI